MALREKHLGNSEKSVRLPVLPLRDLVAFPGTLTTLHVAREASLRALSKAMREDRRVLLVSQRDSSIDEPHTTDLHEIGCLCEVLQSTHLPDGSQRASLRGLERVRIRRFEVKGSVLFGSGELEPDISSAGGDVDALVRVCFEKFSDVVQLNESIPPEAAAGIAHLSDPSAVANNIAHHLPVKPAAKQELLAEADVKARLWLLSKLLGQEIDVLNAAKKIHSQVQSELNEAQRIYYLREQLRVVQDELRQYENRVGETEEYRTKLEAAGLSTAAREKAEVEIRRLDRAPAASPEGLTSRTYLDTLLALPWKSFAATDIDMAEAERILDAEHFGLSTPKERVLEHLAVQRLLAASGGHGGRVLALVGPSGVGKTSFARSIANALGRPFARIAIGGVRDESEIRGHRRTYVGSMPGRIIQSLVNCGASNPVLLLDEIDKIGFEGRGDTVSALLEVLDPEQNSAFVDHYLEVPFDLSQVMFVATANNIEMLSPALRDRLEIVEFHGYTEREKLEIARRYLAPKVLAANGLAEGQLEISDAALSELITGFTREAGTRDLARKLDSLARKAARQGGGGTLKVEPDELKTLLGVDAYIGSLRRTFAEIGTAMGLVVSSAGGDVIAIEVSLMPKRGGEPDLTLTGNLGNVMKESVLAALTYLRSSGFDDLLRKDVHLHVPEGGIPKDGPSAGLAMALALASAALGKPMPAGLAVTGEISLRGRVLGVGGVREKVLAALRYQMATVIIPEENAAEIAQIEDEIRDRITILPVANLSEALHFARLEVPAP